MEGLETNVRAANARIEKLETEVESLRRDLAHVMEGRHADQEQLYQQLSAVRGDIMQRLAIVDELRAHIESLSVSLRDTQRSLMQREQEHDELSRALESARARVESFENRSVEIRSLAERVRQEAESLGGDVGGAIEGVRAVRESLTRHSEATLMALEALRENDGEAVKRLGLIEEARRAERAKADRLEAELAKLVATDESLRAATEKLNRVVSENDTALAADVRALREELGASITTLRQVSDERVARQQAATDEALTLAAQARDTSSALNDGYSRLRGRLEAAVHQLTSSERQRLERAAERALQELRSYDDGTRGEGAGPDR